MLDGIYGAELITVKIHFLKVDKKTDFNLIGSYNFLIERTRENHCAMKSILE